MGKPGRGHALSSHAESIGMWRRTWGTETSQYLQEEKEISIPRVAVSETGPAQTVLTSVGTGLWDHHQRTRTRSGRAWEGSPQRVKAPYTKRVEASMAPEYSGTRGTPEESARTIS